jgi:hypothetical protein
MIKFIKHVKSQILLNNVSMETKELIESKSNKYKELWLAYKYSDEIMPHYINSKHKQEYDLDISIDKVKKELQIRFDVDGIQKMLSDKKPELMSLVDFEKLISNDLVISEKHYRITQQEVFISFNATIPFSHNYKDLIILNFEELSHQYLLDGKHRYFEYKQHGTQPIPVKTIGSLDAYKYIVYKKDFIVYAILHNMTVLSCYVAGHEADLNKLIDVDMYL